MTSCSRRRWILLFLRVDLAHAQFSLVEAGHLPKDASTERDGGSKWEYGQCYRPQVFAIWCCLSAEAELIEDGFIMVECVSGLFGDWRW